MNMTALSYWLLATTLSSTSTNHLTFAANTPNDDSDSDGAMALRGIKRKLFSPTITTTTNNNSSSNNNSKNAQRGWERKVANNDCTIQVLSLLQIPDADPLEEDEVFDCELDPTDAGGYSGFMRKLSMNGSQNNVMRRMLDDGEIVPGRSKLKLRGLGVEFDGREIELPPGLDLKDRVEKNDWHSNGNDNSNGNSKSGNGNNRSNGLSDRHLEGDAFGQKPMAVVKVIDVNGLQRSESPSQIGDDIFGTNGDPVNLKSQLYGCSMGQLEVQVGVPEHDSMYEPEAPGVFQVTLDISLLDNDRYTIHDSVTAQVAAVYGINLPGPYEQVMYVVEKCYVGCGWAAYAYVNSWMSVFQSDYYKHAGVQLHELGHNFGFAHSGGLDEQTYTDHTGLMGNPLYSDDIGKMCFNAAKNWQVGWYDSRKLAIDPAAGGPTWSEQYTIVGIADFDHPATQGYNVVLKLETGTSNDYFIGFNRAIGVNAENDEADDELTIVTTGANGESYSQSYLKAHLLEGESYEITEHFSPPVTVRLIEIVKPANEPWRAILEVKNSTPQPTGAPTPCNAVELIVNVLTDNFPGETSWTLQNICTNEEHMSIARNEIYQTAGTQYSNTYCVPPAQYDFTLSDSYGDGICCGYGNGSYEVMYNGSVVKQGGQFVGSESETFGACASGPTNPPTKAPTDGPTRTPTPPPTSANPTKSPTDEPSKNPTPSPTTVMPTKAPTDAPSKAPTDEPTKDPTPSPTTNMPTKAPTDSPSKAPTDEPTKSSTPSPTTNMPTKAPTDSPSNAPTDEPTKDPTPFPTTNVPTKFPTNEPTTKPTKAPTDEPTKEPTESPSSSPTKKPTPPPTKTPPPSAPPTNSPTLTPTNPDQPTDSPTKPPTPSPTPQPTNAIVTPAPTVGPTSAGPTPCQAISIDVDILTDKFPAETSWTLTNTCTGATVDSTSYENGSTNYSDNYCVPVAEYTFTMNDSFDDGICCAHGNGSYAVRMNGIVVAEGAEFTSSETSDPFGSGCAPSTPPPTGTPTTPPPTGLSIVATYDSNLGVPRCSSIGQSCTSDQLLISKRSNAGGTVEPNGPGSNTLDGCVDGTKGTHLNDESVERITVSAVGTELVTGSGVMIKAVVWPWSNGSADMADFYHTNDANNPNWQFLGSRSAVGESGVLRTLTVPHILTDGPLQAVRVNFRFGGNQESPCSLGNYDDTDDLVFAVAPNAVAASPMRLPMIAPAKPPEIKCDGMDKNRCGDAPLICKWKGGVKFGRCLHVGETSFGRSSQASRD